jgi:hyperosmotically inducible periplasmic protein
MTMKRLLPASAPIVLTLLLAGPGIARAQECAAQRAGEALDNAGRNLRRGVQNAFPRVRMAVHEQQVVARVYSRLHWDKALVGSALELEVFADGTTVLRGAVADEATRKRASLLARDTVGVTRVVDELVVSPARVIEAPATTVVVPPGTTVIESTPAPSTTTIIKP